jgi:hypothetical protein
MKAYNVGYRTTRVVLNSKDVVANSAKNAVRSVRSGVVGFVAGVKAAKNEQRSIIVVEK